MEHCEHSGSDRPHRGRDRRQRRPGVGDRTGTGRRRGARRHGRPRSGQGGTSGSGHPRRPSRREARDRAVGPRLVGFGACGRRSNPRQPPSRRHPRQQRRRHGLPRAPHRRWLRDAARGQPPRTFRADGPPLAGAAACRRRACRVGDQHGASHGIRDRSGESAPQRQVRTVEGLRPVEARQFPFRHRLEQTLRGRGRQTEKLDRAPRPVEHRAAGRERSRVARRRASEVLPRPGRPHGHDARAGRAAADSSRDGSRREGWGVLRSAVRQQRAARSQADLPPSRHVECDRDAVAGVRTRDRRHARRCGRRRKGVDLYAFQRGQRHRRGAEDT